jgi:acyl carrier protein phosphodiesterase
MNWLAHFALSPRRDRVRLGNWLPDLFGPAELQLLTDLEIQAGVTLHRIIDHTTDRNPRVQASLQSLPPGLRRGGGIVLDVYWDHFLSVNFAQLTGESLEPFVQGVLADLRQTQHLAPPGTAEVLAAMTAESWLTSYTTPDGVELTLTRIRRRLSKRAHEAFSPAMARDFLTQHHESLEREFRAIWSSLNSAVQSSSRTVALIGN